MIDPLRVARLARAKSLRERETTAERLLWRALKRIPMEQTHFRRQVPIGPYIADFACLGARLIIEVDGPSHSFEGQEKHDIRRTQFFNAEGFRVLRFWNDAVRTDIDSVIETIFAALQEASTNLSASRGG